MYDLFRVYSLSVKPFIKNFYVVIVFEVVDIILVCMHSFSVPISRNKTGDSFAHNYDEIKVNKTAHFSGDKLYVINCIGYKSKFSIITSFHPQIFNGSEERNAGRERGGVKRRGAWSGSGAGKGQSASRGMGGRRRRRGRASLVTLNREDCARMRKLRSQKKERLQVKLYLYGITQLQ